MKRELNTDEGRSEVDARVRADISMEEILNPEPGLHWAAWSGLANVVDVQLTNGADFRWTDEHGNTALHLAAREGHVAVVDRLLKAGADPDLCNLEAATPLMLATKGGHWPVVDRMQHALQSASAARFTQPSAIGQQPCDPRERSVASNSDRAASTAPSHLSPVHQNMRPHVDESSPRIPPRQLLGPRR